MKNNSLKKHMESLKDERKVDEVYFDWSVIGQAEQAMKKSHDPSQAESKNLGQSYDDVAGSFMDSLHEVNDKKKKPKKGSSSFTKMYKEYGAKLEEYIRPEESSYNYNTVPDDLLE